MLATVALVRRAGDSPNRCTTSFTSTRSYTGAAAAAPASPCCCAVSFHDAGHAAPAAAPSSDVNSTKSTADEVTRETFSASEFLVWSCGRWWWWVWWWSRCRRHCQCMRSCVRACVNARVRACARACVYDSADGRASWRVCVIVGATTLSAAALALNF